MKRAALELTILLGLMLVAGTAYTLAIRGNPERALPWVSPVLPSGWPELPSADVVQGSGTSGSDGPAAETARTGTGAEAPVEPAGSPPGAAAVSPDGGSVEPAPASDEPFRFIDHDEALRHYEEGIALFIDARRTREYVAGHIRGARSISNYEADAAEKIGAMMDEVPFEIPVVVYCTRSKDCEDSQILAAKLHDVGFLDLMVYRGGFPEWNEKEPTRVATGREPGEK